MGSLSIDMTSLVARQCKGATFAGSKRSQSLQTVRRGTERQLVCLLFGGASGGVSSIRSNSVVRTRRRLSLSVHAAASGEQEVVIVGAGDWAILRNVFDPSRMHLAD